MKTKTLFRLAVTMVMAFLFLTTSSCKKKHPGSIDPAFAQYISAFTSGSISAAGTIQIHLTDAYRGQVDTTVPLAEEWLEFSPDIDGELYWKDAQTLEFRPAKWLPRGENYEAEFHLGQVTEVPDNLREFTFTFGVMNQHMDVEVESVHAYRNDDLRWMTMAGTVRTIDVCDPAQLPNTVAANQNGQALKISWTTSENGYYHFSVDSIERKETAQEVVLTWTGKPIESEQSGEIKQEIPAFGDFKVFFTRVVQQPEQYVVLQFSDPLLPGQNLEGLIDMVVQENERLTVENNEVRLYPAFRLSGQQQIMVHSGVKNIMGYTMKQDQMLTVTFEELKPAIEIPDPTKVILPSTDGLAFPFRAVNITAVDVRVIRIYENNVPQFLQVNDLDGENELRRVGRPIANKTIQLNDGSKDLASWNLFFIDLDEIIQAEPGAIYRVELGFKKAYSLYSCLDSASRAEATQTVQEPNWDEADEEQSSYWDAYEEYYYSDYDGENYDWDYDYDQRENPCDDAFYKSRRPVGKNIIASDLGLIVKKGADNSMLFAVNDLKSTKPISGVKLQVLNYQQQVIAEVETDGDGMANVDHISGTPFLLVATKDKQHGYLKIDGGHSLSTSTFDVSGAAIDKGLKGFIYGERGVWRPGDTLFLAFILEDEKKLLPENHPVHFELTNPRGQVVQKMIKSKGENGFYRFTCMTNESAETGNYQANVRVGGATFSKTIKIETVKPNRLKLALDFGKEQINADDKSLSGTLSAKWLHGAIANNLKANVSVTFTQGKTAFSRYTEYSFDDPQQAFSPEEKVIYDGFLNAQGTAQVGCSAHLEGQAPGMLNANFSVKVFEQGGDFSVDRFTIPYAPYSSFVGVKLPKGDAARGMLLTDQQHKIETICVDANGKAKQSQSLHYRFYKVQWRWWWEQSANNLSNYNGEESNELLAEGSFGSGADGRGSFNIQVNYPDWGRYLVQVTDEESGHTTGQYVYIDWPGWAGRAQRENPGGASMLMFSIDKEKYNIGEKCTVTFPSSGQGRAMISIENGSSVIEHHWVDAEKDQTTFTFETTEAMAPNAYVNITLIQPHNQTANDLPIRLYGVVPLFVENANSHLEPLIAMKDELEPEKEFEVRVSEKTGKAMTYTLAIVDEGLLDITRYKTPDPWNYFYAREALGVSTFDMYDQVIGAFGTKLEKLLGLGGDGEINGKAKNKVNRFKPVVIYAGPFTIGAGQSKTHKFTMPNYVGSVKVMVVAGKDQAYGNAEKAVPVKKPLMVLASMPRVLGPGEEVKLPVTVFAMDKNIHDVNVKVEYNDQFTTMDKSSINMNFKTPGDEVANFSLKVADKIGVGTIHVTATSGKFKSTYDVELEVRNPNPPITNTLDAVVNPGQSWTGNFDLVGVSGTNSAVLEVSSLPSVDFGRRLKYLIQYPHGCIEQTTSSAFPQLYVSDIMESNDNVKKRTTENVKAAISRLSSFQMRNGGMSYWPGEAQANEWGTNYAGHFMLEAKAKGYTLPSGFEASWISYQKTAALNWQPKNSSSGDYYYSESDLVQAYRLYTLALANAPELGAMNRLKEYGQISNVAKWRLAGAYALAGQKEIANGLISNLNTAITPYTSTGGTFGSDDRDIAMIIEVLTLLDQKGKAAPLVISLSKEMSSENFYSTQTTAYSLLAISKFAGKETGKQVKFTYALNGKSSKELYSQRAFYQEELSAKMKGNSVSFNNLSGNILYARVILRGQPATGQETAANNNLNMAVRYLDMTGKPIDISRMNQGTDFTAEVSITHPGTNRRYDELALSQIFPSGWEIINSRMDVTVAGLKSDAFDYQDIRDDRVYTYFDLMPNQTRTYKVKLNASYLGKFYMPSVNCEAMYDHTINARTTGQWVEVVSNNGNLANK